METCVDISLYPLKEGYRPLILDFIQQLHKAEDIRIETNSMSTQICGPYETVFAVLKEGIKRSFDQSGDQVFVLKILKIADEAHH
jgi:uncharacterized protein YqgV (UPF0045/DUF77 family)